MSFKNQADFVVQKCGGYTKVAAMLSVDYHVVYGWVHRSASGHVPAEHQKALIEQARLANIQLTEQDLIFPALDTKSTAGSA